MWYSMDCSSPLGDLLAVSDGTFLTGLWFKGQKKKLPPPGEIVSRAGLPVFQELERWLEDYFCGKDPGPIPPAAPSGSAFQEAVWALLQEIPYGIPSPTVLWLPGSTVPCPPRLWGARWDATPSLS